MIKRHPLLVEGIKAAKAGDKARAQRLLAHVIRRSPDSAEAWLWLSSTFDTPQGRAFCLENVLSIDPGNRPAQRGLAALAAMPARPPLAPPQAAITASTVEGGVVAAPLPAARPARPGRLSRLRGQPRFWQAVLICLGVIALALVGVLAYDLVKSPAGDELVAAGPLPTAASPHPQRTLRPTFTFTPQPTDTSLPTDTPTLVPTPTFTDTPTPSPTPTPTLTSTPQPVHRSGSLAPTAAAPPTPRPTLPPLVWDPRLTALGVRLEPVQISTGVGYWRLVEARWSDGQESAGKHAIYVEVLNRNGSRSVGQPVIFEWSSGRLTLLVENRPAPDWGVNFPMFAVLGSYSARVGAELSDRVVGMGMGTIENPDFTVHTCFYLTFRWTQR
jgi:hypothetical protein